MSIFNQANHNNLAKGALLPFRVYTTPWNAIGQIDDFPVGLPQMLVFNGTNQTEAKKPNHLYVIHSNDGFRVFDMDSGGEYEWKVAQDQVMIRRKISG